jgi:23S rRNA-/tRNA-specific pseudouridylate synthase
MNKKIEYINITDDYIVVKKPANMKLYGDENEKEVLNKLVHKEHDLFLNHTDKFGIIYHVEEEIEGIVLLSRNKNFHEKILKIIEEKLFKIKYLAVVFSEKNNKSFKQKDAISLILNNKIHIDMFYEIINTHHLYNTLSIYTNKHINHQINILLNHIKTNIVGDKKYGGMEFDTLCLFITEIFFIYKGAEIHFSLNMFYTHKINNLLMRLHF